MAPSGRKKTTSKPNDPDETNSRTVALADSDQPSQLRRSKRNTTASATQETGAKRKGPASLKSEEVPAKKVAKKVTPKVSSKTEEKKITKNVTSQKTIKSEDIKEEKVTDEGESDRKPGAGKRTKKIKAERVEPATGTERGKKIKTEPKLENEETVEGSVEIKKEVDSNMTAVRQGVNKMAVCTGTKFVGAHMSIAGGLHKAVQGAVDIGAKSFAMFLRSQRQWAAKPLDDKVAEKFREACKEHNFSPWHIIPHGSYLLNSGSPNPETLHKTRDTLADELKRCETLGLAMYNFHPGSTCGEISVEECLDKIGETINLVHKQTNSVMTLIENMSCQGNTVGGKFEELGGIIDRVNDKTRIGVCLDTCHAFAAGFDLASESGYEGMMADFDKIVGLKYLKAVHLNDSKGKVGNHLDRHENIGKGHIGLKAFNRLMNDPRFDDIPIVLETPAEEDDVYEREIRLLYSMQDAKK